jgi:hypothetical protein
MNTDDSKNQPPQAQTSSPSPNADTGQVLSELADTMKTVDTKSPEAKLNATSISDGKGGRIELNEDKANNKSNVIRGIEEDKDVIKGVE